MPDRLVILEGPDGAGKSTAAALVQSALKERGEPARVVAFPGSDQDTLGRHIHDLHHRPAEYGVGSIHPTSLQMLHAAAHVDAIHRCIRPALSAGEWVIMDRFWWSTIIYGRVLGADARSLLLLEQLARHHWAFASPRVACVFLPATAPPGSATAPDPRLAAAYEVFLDELGEPFPVHRIRDWGSARGRADSIISWLGFIR